MITNEEKEMMHAPQEEIQLVTMISEEGDYEEFLWVLAAEAARYRELDEDYRTSLISPYRYYW